MPSQSLQLYQGHVDLRYNHTGWLGIKHQLTYYLEFHQDNQHALKVSEFSKCWRWTPDVPDEHQMYQERSN